MCVHYLPIHIKDLSMISHRTTLTILLLGSLASHNITAMDMTSFIFSTNYSEKKTTEKRIAAINTIDNILKYNGPILYTAKPRNLIRKNPSTWELPNDRKKQFYPYPQPNNAKNHQYKWDPKLYETKFKAALCENLWLRKENGHSESQLQTHKAALLKTLHKNKQIIIQRQIDLLNVINHLLVYDMYYPKMKTLTCYKQKPLLEWKK
jgi:hypothetical protein